MHQELAGFGCGRAHIYGGWRFRQEEKNWGEGGAYRVLGHIAIGGATGGAQGAAGAGVVATAAPVLDNVQASLTEQFINNGMDPRTAEDTARAITGGAAAVIGGAAGGSTGAITGLPAPNPSSTPRPIPLPESPTNLERSI